MPRQHICDPIRQSTFEDEMALWARIANGDADVEDVTTDHICQAMYALLRRILALSLGQELLNGDIQQLASRRPYIKPAANNDVPTSFVMSHQHHHAEEN